jgi:hypothetical protein
VKPLCEVTVNLKDLPPVCVTERTSELGKKYYNFSFQVQVVFGSELLFKLVGDEKVVGSVAAEYHI